MNSVPPKTNASGGRKREGFDYKSSILTSRYACLLKVISSRFQDKGQSRFKFMATDKHFLTFPVCVVIMRNASAGM